MNQKLNYYLTIISQNVEYQRIIYGVLKRLHIHSYHPYRADYEQEAHLIMTLELQDFHEQNFSQSDTKEVDLFLYQRLYWSLLEKLRAEQIQRHDIQFSIDQINDDHHDEEAPNMLSKIFTTSQSTANFVTVKSINLSSSYYRSSPTSTGDI